MSEERKAWNVVVRIDTKNPDKPFWHTIGRAWESERNPGSFKLMLNSLPLSPDLYLFPAVKRDVKTQDGLAQSLNRQVPTDTVYDGDDVPF